MRKLTETEFNKEVRGCQETIKTEEYTYFKETDIRYIRGDKFGKVEKKIEKLQKKAVKYGLTPPTFEILERDIIVEVKVETDGADYFYEVPFIKVSLKADDIIKLDGNYRLIGVLDHKEGLVRSVPNEEIPTQYLGIDGNCDHCNHRRYRVETFIVQNEAGEYKQIGRSCLKDYLGVDGNHLSYVFSSLFLEESNYDEDNISGGSGYDVPQWHLRTIIASTLVAVERFGWVSKSAEADDETKWATAGRVMLFLDPPTRVKLDETEKLIPTDDELNRADEIIEWTKNIDTSVSYNDYEFNLKTIAEKGSASGRYFALACSMVICYMKANDLVKKKAERENLDANSDYVGEIKKRMEFGKVKVESSQKFENNWGVTNMIKFRDENNNVLIWWASGSQGLEVGEEFEIVGTVKEHEEYNGNKQTKILRVKIKEKWLEAKIISCEDKEVWYADKIGETVTVKESKDYKQYLEGKDNLYYDRVDMEIIGEVK